MPTDQLVNIVLGNPTALFADGADLAVGQKFLDVFKSNGFYDIDTARVYEHGEKNFGLLKVTSQGFKIDTKVASFAPGSHKAEALNESVRQSLELLGVDKVQILYLHAPDRATPVEEVLRTLNELYKQGKFEKLGLSNYTAAEVAEFVAVADKNGFVRPSVYQGNYSLLVRKGEAELFPLLKKEKIAFYAWSPLAGGLLTGKYTSQNVHQGSHFGHEVIGPIFKGLFAKDSFFAVLDETLLFIKQHNLTLTETALRWLAFHSQLSKANGDAIILGASKPEQFENNIIEIKRGPLPAQVVAYIDKVWEKIKDDSPAYHF